MDFKDALVRAFASKSEEKRVKAMCNHPQGKLVEKLDLQNNQRLCSICNTVVTL